MVYLYSLIAGLLYGIQGLTNKKVANLVSNPILSSLLFNLFSVLGATFLILYDNFSTGIFFSNLFSDYVLLTISTGLTVFAFWGLFSALRELPVSTHILLSRASLLTYTIGGFLILGETVNGYKLLGLVFVLIGIFLSTIRKGKLVINKWAYIQILSSIGFGFIVIIDKVISQNFSYGAYIWLNVLATTIAIGIWGYFSKAYSELKGIPSKYYLFTAISGLTAILGFYFVIASYGLGGDLVIVGAISQIKLPIAVLGGYFFFNERTDLLTKFLGVITVIAGVLLLRL